jgi:hypothetical protein
LGGVFLTVPPSQVGALAEPGLEDRGAVKPSGEAAARPDGTRLPGEGDEDVLGDFLCGWWIAKDTKGGAVHEIHVSTDEFGEGRFVVSSDVGFEELFVCGLTVLHGVGSKGF